MTTSFHFIGGVVLFALCVATLNSVRADEGIGRNTELGDRDLVAQSHKKAKPKEVTYKSVEEKEQPASSTNFKGTPVPQSNDVYFGAGLNYWSSFGLQARYAARLLEKGFVAAINNPFSIEGGVGTTFYGTQGSQTGVSGYHVIVTGRWDFQMDASWIFFGNLGLGYNAVSAGQSSTVKGGGLFPAFGVGAMYNIDGTDWAARADFSYQFFGAGIVRRF